MYSVLDLFSGIGGFSLGLERTGGFKTVAFCEIEPYPRAVLKKHWPDVMCFPDVRLLNRRVLEMFDISVDVICGGFPCQDISLAGKGAGLMGARSGLWSEFHRLIEEIRPRYAIIENVSALRFRGLDQVLGSLTAIGYDAEWHCIPASAVGAPHRRDRIWIVAYPQREQLRQQSGRGGGENRTDQTFAAINGEERTFADANSKPTQRITIAWPECSPWDAEPDVGCVVDGLPYGLVADDLRALGNAVVPQIPEIIGRAILAHAA